MLGVVAPGFIRRRGTVWLAILLLWVALGVFSAGTVLVQLPAIRRAGPPPPGTASITLRTFLLQLATWIAWAALAPVALWLRRVLPIERNSLSRALPLHVTAVVLMCAAHSGVALVMMWLVMPVQQMNGQQATAMLTY
ncbi:MAG TPA: hypothetical protein VFV34_19655, partial [Blastocatellia bacterium]|nr:hypothetical protein [Blastocatellia bacterium]